MRKIEINYQNTTELISNLMTILTQLDVEKESVKKALNGINDLENNYIYEPQIIYDLEYGLNQINRDIQDTEDLIKSINTFSKNIQETDERLAQKFKQDIKGYAKQNNIELVSEFDKWLDKAQMALDGFGLIPGVGEIADGVNGLIYLFKGDIKNAGISFLSMIPEVGDTAKGVRYFDKASDILKYTDKAVDLEKSSKKLSKATKNLDIKDIDFKINSNKSNYKIKSNRIKVKENYYAKSSVQYEKLKTYYKQAERYGTGSIKELPDGRFRFYEKIKPARTQGEMAGARHVREWNHKTGVKRDWYETVDHLGNIRQVRPSPDITGGIKVHYMFDAKGNYTGSWSPKK